MIFMSLKMPIPGSYDIFKILCSFPSRIQRYAEFSVGVEEFAQAVINTEEVIGSCVYPIFLHENTINPKIQKALSAVVELLRSQVLLPCANSKL